MKEWFKIFKELAAEEINFILTLVVAAVIVGVAMLGYILINTPK